MKPIEIEIENHGDEAVVRLSGEFDLASAREFLRAVAEVHGQAPKVVTVDLSQVSFMGASGLRSLLDLEARSRREGFRLEVVKGPPLVHRVFEMTGVERRLDMVDSR